MTVLFLCTVHETDTVCNIKLSDEIFSLPMVIKQHRPQPDCLLNNVIHLPKEGKKCEHTPALIVPAVPHSSTPL